MLKDCSALLRIVFRLLVVLYVCRFAIVTKWFCLTRLETRTKESNIYASIRVANPGCAMKVNDGNLGAPSTDHDPLVKGLSLSIDVGTRKMVNYA